MSDAIAVSVIIPTRNRRRLLAECLDSVRRQAGIEWEIIVVDDGSTDDTWAWLSELTDPRLLRLRHDVPQRQSVARNRGLQHARGRHVMFLDDDDLLHPHALASLVAALDRHHTVVAAIGAREDWFTDQGYRRRDVHPRRERVHDAVDMLLAGWSAVPSQTLFRGSSVRAVCGFDPARTWCEDRDLLHRVAEQGPFAFCPAPVVTYRITPTQRRPPDIRVLRERVARQAIRRMPKVRWREALRLRRFVRLSDSAEDQCMTGSPLRGVWLMGRAVAGAPAVVRLPVIVMWVARRLIGRVARRIVPATAVTSATEP